ncbi:GNAT family N-acetyltransferase [Hazenella sp. IB182357]|uniref:GNAT family N-acetyltransferase n=1 Tax=Polycladospora coralii TaxID=2771432 RepID=A0A926RUM8_9BACL|nr:GNAT family N-acetyltransferase [Polycladospora coralii]MBD1372554.1 GNAT family N-acetyltransferase [Polycladospora coralii]MBS7531323.1 GNAT family N-acetyltransferase [Polycladospora coralii]
MIEVRRLRSDDDRKYLDYIIRNRTFMKPYEPVRPDEYYTRDGQKKRLVEAEEQWEKDEKYSFGIFLDDRQLLIGNINLSNIARGAFQNCTIGYSLDQAYNRKGFMTTAVKKVAQLAFRELHLHRIEAAVKLDNIASCRVLEKVGFSFIGISHYHLQINGVWQDHKIYALTVEQSGVLTK